MNARSDFPGRWPDASRPVLSMGAAPRPALPPRDHPVHDARTLTGPEGLAQIVLDGQVYALRITRAGKLILTK